MTKNSISTTTHRAENTATPGSVCDLPIRYHPAIEESIEDWAFDCGHTSASLRQASQLAIRTRHREATIKHPADRALGYRPDVLHLTMGWFHVYYSVESDHVLIRGYGWPLNREPLDDFDGGGYYGDFHRPD